MKLKHACALILANASMRYYEPRLFASMLKIVAKQTSSIDTAPTTAVLAALADLGIQHGEIAELDFLLQSFLLNPEVFSTAQLCQGSWAVSVLCQWEEHTLQGVKEQLAQKLSREKLGGEGELGGLQQRQLHQAHVLAEMQGKGRLLQTHLFQICKKSWVRGVLEGGQGKRGRFAQEVVESVQLVVKEGRRIGRLWLFLVLKIAIVWVVYVCVCCIIYVQRCVMNTYFEFILLNSVNELLYQFVICRLHFFQVNPIKLVGKVLVFVLLDSYLLYIGNEHIELCIAMHDRPMYISQIKLSIKYWVCCNALLFI